MPPSLLRRRLAFSLITAGALLGALELAGRLLLTTPSADPLSDSGRSVAMLYVPGPSPVIAEGALRRLEGPLFREQQWRTPAAPGTRRVAVVGDSTVHGQLPTTLAAGLSAADPTFEVLNFGVGGMASDRVRVTSALALAEEPELLVVYVGHNELKEARLNPQSTQPLGVRVAWMGLVDTGLGRMLAPWLSRPPPPPEPALGSKVAMVEPEAMGVPDAAELAGVEARYQDNLRDICAQATAAQVPVAFVVPVSSYVNPGAVDAAPIEGLEVQRVFAEALHALELGQADRVEAQAQALLAQHGEHHVLRLLLGLARVHLGKEEAGLADLRRARALDPSQARLGSQLGPLIASVAQECGATLVDPAPAFLAQDGIFAPADPLFMDLVHPTPAGDVVLAQAIAEGAGLPWATPAVLPEAASTDAERGWRLPEREWIPGPDGQVGATPPSPVQGAGPLGPADGAKGPPLPQGASQRPPADGAKGPPLPAQQAPPR